MFLFSFSLLPTHTAYCKYEATLRHVPLCEGRGAYRVPLFNWSVGMCVCVCHIEFVVFNKARPRERSHRGRFLPLGKKASSYRGVYRVPLFS